MTEIPPDNNYNWPPEKAPDPAEARVTRILQADNDRAEHAAKAAHMRLLLLLGGIAGMLALLGLLMGGLAWHKTTSVGFAIMGLGACFVGYWAQALQVFGPAPRLKGIVSVSVGVSNGAGLVAFLLLFS